MGVHVGDHLFHGVKLVPVPGLFRLVGALQGGDLFIQGLQLVVDGVVLFGAAALDAGQLDQGAGAAAS